MNAKTKITLVSSCCKDIALPIDTTYLQYYCDKCKQNCDVIKQVRTVQTEIDKLKKDINFRSFSFYDGNKHRSKR